MVAGFVEACALLAAMRSEDVETLRTFHETHFPMTREMSTDDETRRDAGGDVRGPVLGRTFGEIPERAHAHVGCTVGVSAGEHASQLYRGLVPPESGRLEPGLFRGVRGSARCRGDGTGRFGGRSAGRVSGGMADGGAATLGSDRVGSGRT